jgi:hypothetical protein
MSTKTIITRDCDIIYWQSGPWSGKARPFASETRQITGGYLRALCETWRDYYCQGKRFVGDKGVKCYIHRDQLRQVFPGCRFLFCVRHPLDQLSGLLNDDWVGNRAMAKEPKTAWEQVRMYVRMWRKVCRESEDVLVVKYEHFAKPDTLNTALATCYTHIGADLEGVCPGNFAPYVSAASVGRWQNDSAVCDLLDTWEHLRIMTSNQREALTQPPDCYLDALDDAEWAMKQ